MSKPRAINIFLNDGDPEGLRSAQISLSTILAIGFRKLQLKAARAAFPELDRPGVYILLGVDEA
ncbi:MAG: GIY-YIG nuclease family protein, partial [Proteobacteria bacterium]|nr:GIY-YIG nuclease family protein [Pseudomonadota bacterium]